MRKAGQGLLKKATALALAAMIAVVVPTAVLAEQTDDDRGGDRNDIGDAGGF